MITPNTIPAVRTLRWLLLGGMPVCLLCFTGCGFGGGKRQNDQFFTSGSREADQRASQRMAKAEQLEGPEASTGSDEPTSGPGENNERPALAEGKITLFDRLGANEGISRIVADFVQRALADPRVNWQRKGIEHGFLRHTPVVDWMPTPANIATLNRHLVQFLGVTTGGPARYDGKEIQSTHAEMRITNPEFDAVIGDLKASLDRLRIADREQKELLAIVESTRPQIVTER